MGEFVGAVKQAEVLVSPKGCFLEMGAPVGVDGLPICRGTGVGPLKGMAVPPRPCIMESFLLQVSFSNLS